MISAVRASIAASIAVFTVAGCSATVAGRPIKAAARVGGNGVDVALLDPGNYPTKPKPPFGVAGDATKGARVEARRMADNVVGPWEVDPALSGSEQFDTGVQMDPAAWLNAPIGDDVAQHNFVTAFSSGRYAETGPHKGLSHTVLRFASPQDASAAAADMASKSGALTITPDEPPVPTTPIPIPRHPDTPAVFHDYNSEDLANNVKEVHHEVIAITAHGPYVFYQWSWSAESADTATQMVATTLDLQGPLIDQFKPTPVEQLPGLPIDPGGLFARTLPPPKGDETINDGVLTAQGILHFEGNPVRAQALFKSAGLQQVGYNILTYVYQTPDAASADRVLGMLVDDQAHTKDVGAPGVKGMPAAKCFRTPKNPALLQAFVCMATAGRYAFWIQAEHEAEAHQETAAQYLMLTK